MSGICGLVSLDGTPVARAALAQMTSVLSRRGPEGTGHHCLDVAALGHTLLATTPEAVREALPLVHEPTGCVITADARLDNRDELLALLALRDRASNIGDAEVILCAYLRWGAECAAHLLGDFAFAIWDPRSAQLTCARDQFGLRPLYYHHTPGHFVAFASEPRAILVVPGTPYRINEGRIADFLVSELEGIDFTSTFFDDVYRLPPAHVLTVARGRVDVRRYWTLEPGPELRLASNAEYAEAFLEVFTASVRSRLRSAGPVGSMLSGGMDSGSVVGVASRLLAEAGQGPLLTFSATASDATRCIETRTIHAAMQMPGLDCTTMTGEQLYELEPELSTLTWGVDEPFDGYMTLPRAMYMLAHRRGCKVLLDGVSGDVVLGEGNYIARLIRRGRWGQAHAAAAGQDRFWEGQYPVWPELVRSGRSAITPNIVRAVRARVWGERAARREAVRMVAESPIDSSFAERIRLHQRVRTWRCQSAAVAADYGTDCARAITQPHVTVARERYDRVAASQAIEPRDPFLDRRVVSLLIRVPGSQKLGDGWPKIILRRAMQGILPDAVLWRRGKQHLGWDFTQRWAGHRDAALAAHLHDNRDLIATYVTNGFANRWQQSPAHELAQSEGVHEVCRLGAWMQQYSQRPTVTRPNAPRSQRASHT